MPTQSAWVRMVQAEIIVRDICRRNPGLSRSVDETDESPDWASCINAPFTVSKGRAGCGTDDFYTTCSGRTMWGIDGDGIVWYVIFLCP